MARLTKKERERKLRKQISDRNYRFRKMDPSKQRVAIAKDVIEMLNSEKLVAQTGVYLSSEDLKWVPKFKNVMKLAETVTTLAWDDDGSYKTSKKLAKAEKELTCAADVQLQEIFSNDAVQCTVCGIGSAFVASVMRADRITLKSFLPDDSSDADEISTDPEQVLNSDDVQREYLGQFFSAEQMSLIEACFEKAPDFAIARGVAWEVAHRADKFGRAFDDDGDRLRAIMQNIVDNNGLFVP